MEVTEGGWEAGVGEAGMRGKLVICGSQWTFSLNHEKYGPAQLRVPQRSAILLSSLSESVSSMAVS